MSTFTIIDSFNVTKELAARPNGMTKGWWFVVDGQFSTSDKLPETGRKVTIQKPSGEKIKTKLAKCELRHGSLALQFAGLTNTDIPRLSVADISEKWL